MGFEEQVRLVWRHRFWLLALSLFAAIAVFVFASLRDSTYAASAVIGVTPGPAIGGNSVGVDTVSFTTNQYARLVRSDAVLNSGAAAAGKGTTLEDMRKRVSSRSAPANGTVTVTAKASTADESSKVATAVATATIDQGQKDQQARRDASLTVLRAQQDALRGQLALTAADGSNRPQLDAQYQSVVQQIASQQAAPFDTAQLLETPELPKAPGGPGSKSLALFAFLATFVLGAEGIVIAVRLRRGSQPPPAAEPPVVAEPQPEPTDDRERARVPLLPLYTALPDAVLARVDEGHRLIAIVGSSDFPATHDVTLALGELLARRGHATLVVEGDMTNPTLASRLSIRSQAGLTDVLAGGATLDRTQRQTSVPGLYVLPSGRAVERPDVLVGVDNVQHVLSSSACEIVLVSLPASMSAEDRDRMAGQLHGVVSIVRDGRMRARQVRSALVELGNLHHILVGVGLVDVVPNPDVEVITRRPDRGTAKRSANGDGAQPAPQAAAAPPEPSGEPTMQDPLPRA